MYFYTSWLLCHTVFSLWGCTGQVLEFIILVWYISFYPTLSWHVPYVDQSDPIRTHSIIILLSHTYRIELYIVVVLFQKKDYHQQQNMPTSPHFFIKKVVKISLLSFHIVFYPSTPHRNRTPTPFDCCVMHSWWWYMLLGEISPHIILHLHYQKTIELWRKNIVA